jgi:hypothetical protein
MKTKVFYSKRMVVFSLILMIIMVSGCGGQDTNKADSDFRPNMDGISKSNEFTEAITLLAYRYRRDAVDLINLVNQYSQMTGLFDASALVNSAFIDIELDHYSGSRVTVDEAIQLLSKQFKLNQQMVVELIIDYKTLQKTYCEVEYEYDLEGFIDPAAR